MNRILSMTAAAVFAFVATAQADTTDTKWQTRVVVAKQGAHCVDDPNCFNRYHPAIPAVARAKSGDMIVFHTRDALDSDLTLDSNADDLAAVDLNLVHPMTGPAHIEGAERGDVLAITLVDIAPDEYGYTVIVPGFGFLRDIYTEPYLVNWRQSRTHAVSDQMPGVRVPYEAFMGSVGVLPASRRWSLGWHARRRLGRLAALRCRRNRWAHCPAPSAARKEAPKTSAFAPFRRAKMAATWTSSRCKWARRCCCPVSLTAAACLSATFITHRATVRYPAPPSRLARWSR